MAYTLGIDYGTNSVRALVVDVSNGRELATCVVDYPSGKQGILLDLRDANLARQHPGDYLFGLEHSVRGALKEASKTHAFWRIESSLSAWTPLVQAHCRSTTATSHWACRRSGRIIWPPNAGYGKITPAMTKRRKSPTWPPSIARTT
jgi:hypothetical protein